MKQYDTKIKEQLQYKGTVTVTLENKKIKKHNTATKYMFELLLRVLARHPFDANDTPTYMMILNSSKSKEDIVNNPTMDSYKSEMLLNSYLPATPILNLNDGDLKLTYTSVFDNKFLMHTNIASNKNYICLTDLDKQTILAVVEIDSDTLSAIISNSTYQAQIEWEVSLSSDIDITN